MKNYLTPKDAAAELGLSTLAVQHMMRQKIINIGDAYKREGSSRWTYHVYRKLLDTEKARRGL